MADLKTDYKDDILDTSQNTRRKYQMINNQDGTVSFVDVTEYIQQGDSFGADDVNAITDAINKNDGVPVGAVVTFDGSQLPSGFEPYTTAEQSAIAQINDNLALKQPLSDILTKLVNSQIRHYKITQHIGTISALRSYLENASIGDGIELVSFKAPPDGRQSGFMITSAVSSSYYAGIFFGYYFEDFVFFTRAGATNTIKIYKFTKTLQS